MLLLKVFEPQSSTLQSGVSECIWLIGRVIPHPLRSRNTQVELGEDTVLVTVVAGVDAAGNAAAVGTLQVPQPRGPGERRSPAELYSEVHGVVYMY